MVVAITQITKGLKYIEKMPTQLWSYVISMVVLYPAHYFTGLLTAESAVLILFNSVLITLAANGGFETLNKMFPNLFKTTK